MSVNYSLIKEKNKLELKRRADRRRRSKKNDKYLTERII
jgi:hypothetical protein